MKKKIRYIEETYTDKYKFLYQVIQIDVDYDKNSKSVRELFRELGYEYYEDDGFNCYKKEKRELIEPNYISFNRLEREVFMSNDSKDGNGVIKVEE